MSKQTFISIGFHRYGYPCWGKGSTVKEATQRMRRAANNLVLEPSEVYEVFDPEAYINDEGSICQRSGLRPPMKVAGA